MLTQFDLGSAARVARVVRTIEQQYPRARPLVFDGVPPGPRRVFRIGTFSGAWSKGSNKTVTFAGSQITATVTNLFAPVPGSGDCAIARNGTAWFLIAAECD